MSENENGSVRRLEFPVDRTDPRICYGATCSWWGTIYEIGTRVVGGGESISRFGLGNLKLKHRASPDHALPCCPICRGMLMEVASIREWEEGIAQHEKTHPGYGKFIAWLRGKCFRSLKLAQEAYVKETGAILTW